jgi:hypothetical protein
MNFGRISEERERGNILQISKIENKNYGKQISVKRNIVNSLCQLCTYLKEKKLNAENEERYSVTCK